VIRCQRGPSICTRLSRLPGPATDASTISLPNTFDRAPIQKAQPSEVQARQPWLERCGAWVHHLIPRWAEKAGNSRMPSSPSKNDLHSFYTAATIFCIAYAGVSSINTLHFGSHVDTSRLPRTFRQCLASRHGSRQGTCALTRSSP
jgi:hypothetical protein